jgi:hypothetical protein
MALDIEANLEAFLRHRNPGARYASFDYCYNHFQQARDDKDLERLADGEGLTLSCLHLGFYLASWGMMRGSAELLQRSARQLVPVVRAIAAEPSDIWAIDVRDYAERGDEVLALASRIKASFNLQASKTLVTKTMLGVFGCIPGFDRYFQDGFGHVTLRESSLTRIGDFLRDNRSRLNKPVFTLDFATGLPTRRPYPEAKIIDMVFFQEGMNRANASVGRKVRRRIAGGHTGTIVA